MRSVRVFATSNDEILDLLKCVNNSQQSHKSYDEDLNSERIRTIVAESKECSFDERKTISEYGEYPICSTKYLSGIIQNEMR